MVKCHVLILMRSSKVNTRMRRPSVHTCEKTETESGVCVSFPPSVILIYYTTQLTPICCGNESDNLPRSCDYLSNYKIITVTWPVKKTFQKIAPNYFWFFIIFKSYEIIQFSLKRYFQHKQDSLCGTLNPNIQLPGERRVAARLA